MIRSHNPKLWFNVISLVIESTTEVQSSSRRRASYGRLARYGDWNERRWIPVNQNARRTHSGSLQQLGTNQDWLPEARSKSDRANIGSMPGCRKSACTYRFPAIYGITVSRSTALLDIAVSFVLIMSDISRSSSGSCPFGVSFIMRHLLEGRLLRIVFVINRSIWKWITGQERLLLNH